MGMRANIYPAKSGQLYRRWQPGQGYRSDPGVTGLGDDPITPDPGSFAAELDTIPEIGPNDPSLSPDIPDTSLQYPTTGGVTPDAYLSAWTGHEGVNTATPEETAAAQAWLLQNVPAGDQNPADPSLLKALALTASQIATGLTAGTVQKVSTCPSGYQFSTGVCVPGTASPAGQLISGVTNQQLFTWGAVILGGLLFVKLASQR